MKRTLFALAVVALAPTVATAQVSVDGYMRRDGTYVQPHVRSTPNDSRLDNYSTQGNYNPYSGRSGTVSPYSDGLGSSRGLATPNSRRCIGALC